MGGKSTGRPRKPTAIKAAQGTLQKCRTNEAEPKYAIIKKIPNPPKYFNKYSRRIYMETGLELINHGILTGASLAQFLNYCYITGEAIAAQEKAAGEHVMMNDKGTIVASPYVKIIVAYTNLSRQLANEFGLTPASSSKVNATETKQSPLDEWM